MFLGFERKFWKFRAVTLAFTKWPLRAYTQCSSHDVPRTEPGRCTWTGENAGCGAKSGAETPGPVATWPGPLPRRAPPSASATVSYLPHQPGAGGDRAVPRTTGDRGVPPAPSETQSWASAVTGSGPALRGPQACRVEVPTACSSRARMQEAVGLSGRDGAGGAAWGGRWEGQETRKGQGHRQAVQSGRVITRRLRSDRLLQTPPPRWPGQRQASQAGQEGTRAGRHAWEGTGHRGRRQRTGRKEAQPVEQASRRGRRWRRR